MGYTTHFTGAIALSRKLTMAEAKELLEMADMDRDKAKETTGTDAYLQWVPADTMEHIVWDGGEKFYEYVPLMTWLCGWLDERGITANGTLFWSGESASDVGRLIVTKNVVTTDTDDRPATGHPKPLSLRNLQRMALDQVAAAQR